MWIERHLEKKLKRIANQFPAVLLSGARQAGKTELLRRIFPDYNFSNLDIPSDAEYADKEGLRFLADNPSPLIIDEAQYAPGIFHPLKRKIDQNRHINGQYLLTGSQKFQLMKEVSESLAGRVGIVELETLSKSEISAARPEYGLDQILQRGGYPELYRNPNYEAWDYYRSYVATYLERDLRSQLKVGSLRDFERFLRACALRSAQLLNRSDLARDVGITPNTANSWLSVLQAANIVFLLEPWFSNSAKSLVKAPKLYLADTGLLCFLVGIRNEDDLLKSPLRGAIWESFVFSELRKQQTARQGSWNLFFYRERQLEADFLIERGGRFELFDAKWNTQPDKNDFASLRKVAERLNPDRISAQHVVCRCKKSYPVSPHSWARAVDNVLEESEQDR